MTERALPQRPQFSCWAAGLARSGDKRKTPVTSTRLGLLNGPDQRHPFGPRAEGTRAEDKLLTESGDRAPRNQAPRRAFQAVVAVVSAGLVKHHWGGLRDAEHPGLGRIGERLASWERAGLPADARGNACPESGTKGFLAVPFPLFLRRTARQVARTDRAQGAGGKLPARHGIVDPILWRGFLENVAGSGMGPNGRKFFV